MPKPQGSRIGTSRRRRNPGAESRLGLPSWPARSPPRPRGQSASRWRIRCDRESARPSCVPSPPPPAPVTCSEGLEKKDGFIPLYYDPATGKLWMEISRFGQEFLYITGAPTGLGSNDIGLDRGQIGGERIVKFERLGNKVLMVQPNYGFRSSDTAAAARRGVEESFAISTLWGFKVEAETGGTVLVDATDFAVRDVHDVTGAIARARQGTYKLDVSRSFVDPDRTKVFPKNTEIEVALTYTGDNPGPWVRDVAPSAEQVTMRE